MTRGIVNNKIQSVLGRDKIYLGYDIRIDSRYGNLKGHDIKHYELICHGSSIESNPFFNAKIALDLLKDLHSRYQQQIVKSQDIVKQIDKEVLEEKVLIRELNGSILKAIVQKSVNDNNTYRFETTRKLTPEEYKQIASVCDEGITSWTLAVALLNGQKVKIKKRLKEGSLDIDPATGNLVRWLKDGSYQTVGANAKVTKDELKKTLWLVNDLFIYHPELRTYLTVNAITGNTTAQFISGEFSFKNDDPNLSPIQREALQDLEKLKNASEKEELRTINKTTNESKTVPCFQFGNVIVEENQTA